MLSSQLKLNLSYYSDLYNICLLYTSAELSDKMERWVYLHDLAEKIEAQKRENNNENI